MSNDEDGRFGVVGGRGGLAVTTVDKLTHEWVKTFSGELGAQNAWKLARKLNRAWRVELERRHAEGISVTAPWDHSEVK